MGEGSIARREMLSTGQLEKKYSKRRRRSPAHDSFSDCCSGDPTMNVKANRWILCDCSNFSFAAEVMALFG